MLMQEQQEGRQLQERETLDNLPPELQLPQPPQELQDMFFQ